MPRPPKISNEDILAAARQVFLEQGSSASTLAIAEKAGISEAAIFKRFATKQALFAAAMGLGEPPAWVRVLANQTPTANLKAELTQICEQMLNFYQDVLPRVLMVMSQGNGSLPPMPSIPPPPVRDSQLLAGFLERAMALGYLRPCHTPTIAHMITGAINNFVVTQEVSRKFTLPMPAHAAIDNPTFIHHLLEHLWQGIDPNP
jgi:AcrR family transcriptional regulator